MFLAMYALPSPAVMITDVGAWSSPFFTELLPLALFGAGIFVGVIMVRALMIWIIDGVKSAICKKDQ